ncbi:helix-turn-helix domain-containing protein [Stenotrophomonas sp. CPCC 101365]|uniref:Helix-turn-helix domain-containing protein n=1 Tax=Stenotrophomonas mori TaxID=2871096 RepID=A0ABT0SHC1_9GAMM|nr:helix-turn-helix domain-containing protein [Stenotrophomonas mori]
MTPMHRTSPPDAHADDRDRSTPAHAGAGRAQRQDARLRGILVYIDAHLGDSGLDADRIGAAFAISRPTLYRLFQDLGGVARHVRERRLWLAHRYLAHDPDCSLTWLLYEVGFASERQFQRAFQARYGLSPAQWRICCRARLRRPSAAGRRPVAADPGGDAAGVSG